MVGNIIRAQVMLVLIPTIILALIGCRLGNSGIGGGEIRPALPFLVLYSGAFLFSGLSARRVVLLLYAFLYPGFTEEFFYRGLVQQLLLKVGASPAVAIGLTTLAFAGGHIPDFVFRVYQGMLPLAIGQLASVALFGALMGYGVHRSGMLWPWMVLHALSNVVG